MHLLSLFLLLGVARPDNKAVPFPDTLVHVYPQTDVSKHDLREAFLFKFNSTDPGSVYHDQVITFLGGQTLQLFPREFSPTHIPNQLFMENPSNKRLIMLLKENGKCMDRSGGSGHLIAWQCHGHANQQFSYQQHTGQLLCSGTPLGVGNNGILVFDHRHIAQAGNWIRQYLYDDAIYIVPEFEPSDEQKRPYVLGRTQRSVVLRPWNQDLAELSWIQHYNLLINLRTLDVLTNTPNGPTVHPYVHSILYTRQDWDVHHFPLNSSVLIRSVPAYRSSNLACYVDMDKRVLEVITCSDDTALEHPRNYLTRWKMIPYHQMAEHVQDSKMSGPEKSPCFFIGLSGIPHHGSDQDIHYQFPTTSPHVPIRTEPPSPFPPFKAPIVY